MRSLNSRIGGVAGLLFLALLIAGEQIGDASPNAAVSVEIFGLLMLLPFAATLAARIDTVAVPDAAWIAYTIFGAATTAIAVKLASLPAGWIDRTSDVSTSIREFAEKSNEVSFVLMMWPLGLMLGSISIAAFSGALSLPRWHSIPTALIAVALFANGVALDAVNVPAMLLFLLWMAVTSIVVLRLPRQQAPAT